LSRANFSGADLSRADLYGVNLSGADLSGAENYFNSHDFWAKLIRRQPVETFTEVEWSIIGVIIIHRICWDTIKKRFGDKVMPIFKKLSEFGFDEFEKHYAEVLR
jgi:hypothetical protein